MYSDCNAFAFVQLKLWLTDWLIDWLKGGYPGVEGAVRPAQNWWKATWRCHTTAVETRKVRHVGRHSERHTGSFIRARDVPDTRRGSWKENEQIAQSYLFVPVAAETMGAINEDGMDFLSDLGRRITQSTDDHRQSAFVFQRLSNATMQSLSWVP